MHPASIDLGAAWSTTVAMRLLQKTEKGKYIAPTYPCQQQSVRIGGGKRNFKKPWSHWNVVGDMERICRRWGLWRKIICVKGPQSSVSSWICQNVRQFILPCCQIWGLHDDPLFCEKSKQTRLLSYSQTIAPVVTENSSVSLQEQVWWQFWNFSFSENLLRFFFSELSHLLSGFQVWFRKFNFPQDLVNRKKTLIFLHFQSKTIPRG